MTNTTSPLANKSVLFAVGPALGHVSRLYEAALRLRAIRSDVNISFITPAHGRYAGEIVGRDFEIIPVPISEAAMKMPAYEFAAGFEEVLATRAPDAIVQDMCPLRWTSAMRFSDCPRIVVTNFYLTRVVGAQTFQAGWYEKIGAELDGYRRNKGLPKLQSVFDLYEADRVLLADPLSLLSRCGTLPAHYFGCAPCAWSLKGDLPDELTGIRNAMVLAMGSTGREHFDSDSIEQIARWAGCDTSVYVGSKAAEIGGSGIVDHHYSWLPLERLLAGARIAITQGGAGSTYLALESGVPVIVVPAHRNQEILGEILETADLGLCLSRAASLEKLNRVDYDAISHKVRAFAAELKTQNGAGTIASRIAELL